ncbi:hypothetical protein ASPFODRAFT_54811 [Aspergillus luchuensis CBS 106.47]|uniref:Uncharacterized protein n=1 Tax=Aspergillus luchuensis (strain CBS 106.47) TaxID=1137211 RepID=A0A1M3SYX4_ASPLC|nr:hypothetical protein ASPFODRAFT_54811 [Aspergillus luchuensis CBS 106.47]
MATKTLVVQEYKNDRDRLSPNHYNLQVAKSVASSNGDPQFNVVYSSQILGPNMTISWTPKYGLNWTQNIPNQSAKVTYSGEWQDCALGDTYDLDSTGSWVKINGYKDADPEALNISKNGYGLDVNVIVGIYDPASSKWIFVNPDQLLTGARGKYKPLDNVRLWFEEGIREETMLSSQSTMEHKDDMSKSLRYFHYDTEGRKWESQDSPFVPPRGDE